MGIENASRVMRILSAIKPKTRDEQEFHETGIAGILQSGYALHSRLNFVLPSMTGSAGGSICTDVYCAHMLEALILANYSEAQKILDDVLTHVYETVKHGDESWIVFPGAIVGLLNASTWARNNSAYVELNEEYEAGLYNTVGKMMAHYFRKVPARAPQCSKQIIGQFNDALVQHTDIPAIGREAMTAMLKPFRGIENKFEARAHEMAEKFTHRALSILTFSLQMDALIEAYEFRDGTPEHRASLPSQVM